MALETADEVYQQVVKALSPREQDKLRQMLSAAPQMSGAGRVVTPGRSILELEGLVEYPMYGEDAQAYITRTRREADESGPFETE